MTNQLQTDAQVDANSDRILATLTDRRADSIESFAVLTSEQQGQFAIDAWSIGMRALRTAHAQAQEARLSDIGKTLQEDLSSALSQMVRQHQDGVETTLKQYFDPEDGQLARRLERFTEDEGELARILARFVAPDGGMLADTLARSVGEQSILMKKLSPTDADGVVQTLKEVVTTALGQSQVAFQKSLDPLHQDSPTARFLHALRDELRKAESDRSQQMVTAFKALDAHDPKSLISNLARQTQQASTTLLNALNPADTKSPIALLRNSLTELLDQHMKTAGQLLEEQKQRQEQFETDIREAVVRLETQRSANRASPRGGTEFEDQVFAEVQARLAGGPYLCTSTGNVIGMREARKVGDFVVRFSDESAWAGASVVFEAKHDASYHLDKALKELDLARANRAADVGVFVMAASHAPADFPVFSRHGHNILVTWDPDDGLSVPRLHAAMMLALALASRKQQVKDSASIDAIRDIENILTDELTRIEKMRKASEAIRKHNEVVRKELDKAEGELNDLVGKARETLSALHIGANDEGAERAEPITFHEGGDDTAESA
jgi:hypothetical protein